MFLLVGVNVTEFYVKINPVHNAEPGKPTHNSSFTYTHLLSLRMHQKNATIFRTQL